MSRGPRLRVPRRIRAGTARSSAEGSRLTCAVLADAPGEWVAVDLATGALLRSPAHEADRLSGTTRRSGAPEDPRGASALEAFSVVRFALGSPVDPPDPARPETVVPAEAPVLLGRLKPRRSRRLLRRLAATERGGAALLGTRGPSIAFLDLDGTAPSVVLVRLAKQALRLASSRDGAVEAALTWGGTTQRLPVLDTTARSAALGAPVRELAGEAVAQALGFRPGYALVGLLAVEGGHARKVVLALLPR